MVSCISGVVKLRIKMSKKDADLTENDVQRQSEAFI